MAQHSPESAMCLLFSGGVLFLLTGSCSLPEAAGGCMRPLSLKQFQRIFFHNLCSLRKLCKSMTRSRKLFGRSRGHVRAHLILTRLPQSLKIMWEQGMLSRIVIVTSWWMLTGHPKYYGTSHLKSMSYVFHHCGVCRLWLGRALVGLPESGLQKSGWQQSNRKDINHSLPSSACPNFYNPNLIS